MGREVRRREHRLLVRVNALALLKWRSYTLPMPTMGNTHAHP
jgi:hypothetical protein